MNLQQIDHAALTCRSIERAKDWYCRVLGCEHVFPEQWNGVPIFLRLGSSYLALFPHGNDVHQTSSSGPRIDHIAFRALGYSDFQKAQEHLRACGVLFRFADHEVSHSIHFSDLDDHKLEITTYDVSGTKYVYRKSDEAPL